MIARRWHGWTSESNSEACCSLLTTTVPPEAQALLNRYKDWSFRAAPSCLLARTTLPLAGAPKDCATVMRPTHAVAYWAARTRGMDFSSEDKVDPVRFNRIVWRGLMDTPYPTARSGMQFSWREPAPTRQP